MSNTTTFYDKPTTLNFTDKFIVLTKTQGDDYKASYETLKNLN